MARPRHTPASPAATREFLAFENASLRLGGKTVFKHTNWTWRAGEHWAILGPDGSGKSLIVDAIAGQTWAVRGEVRGPIPAAGAKEAPWATAVARVSPQTQRDLAAQESSFYQLRWHSSLEQGPRTVADYLSQESVEERNPFEVGGRRGNRRRFLRLRRQFADWLGIRGLFPRRLVHLSNGELRKTLLVHALLKSPCLLALEDPYDGLDATARQKLARAVTRLMGEGWPILLTTHRETEIPPAATHLLLVAQHRVIDQGPRRPMLAAWRKRFGSDRTGAVSLPGPKMTELSSRTRPSAGAPLVELRRVSVSGAGRRILRQIDWTLRQGECWALLGPNGAGKTTLLNLIQGDHPQAYSENIRLFGRRTESTQAVWRARQFIGWMSPELHQHYPGGWTAQQVVCSGFFNSVGLHQSCSRRQRLLARQRLIDLGLGRQASEPFGELSFGQQRLVLLARAVVKQPRLLILDEPCQGLDEAQRESLLADVDRAVARSGASLIFVTHHRNEMPRCISRVLRLAAGRIRTMGPGK